ncbi:hypothetical protein ANCCEY_14731 [Ancylostoma ceylanicum]|uniref:Calcineurin-like phosphoesterase domain-containing protein n=1 Tax=Ancylostoma ceylanicum TaxID=53326 RepID=A0A0D6L604_9BILA|nr:hypothetical protein ANCCEY_14731 [Ancylostoma ceylanicum]
MQINFATNTLAGMHLGLDRLVARMRYPPSALIINGDLTDFGHIEQHKEFQKLVNGFIPERHWAFAGLNCAQVIQLNNAVDYETTFSSFLVDWKVNSAMDFLKTELKLLRDVDIPVLINMHQCEGTRLEKLRELISEWYGDFSPQSEENH